MHRWTWPLVVFLLAFLFWSVLFLQFPVLYDTDSYYHLAIGRTYAQEGIVENLRWARMSLLSEGFGDKEFLFHLLLAPFAQGDFPTTGGRLALALLNALLTTTLAVLGRRALGSRGLGMWGLAVPFLVYAGSEAFLSRAVRLRPELLALLLLLAAILCVAHRSYRLLGLVTMLFTLSYTAFHALLGLCFAWFVERGWIDRRWDWRLLLYPVLGAALALILHPHFPHNLVVWKVQSFDFFTHKAVLDVGAEIGPSRSDQLLIANLAWALGLLVLILGARRETSPEPDSSLASRLAQTQHVATAAFGLLYLLMGRFSLYFIPFATLSVVFELRRRGLRVGSFLTLFGRGRAPTIAALLAVALLAVLKTAPLLRGMSEATGQDQSREEDWSSFGRAVPEGARVAAEWGSGQLYLFWAPQARFLNVLDPVFMAVPYPRAHTVLRDVFEGREPDVPVALVDELASDHLALSRFHQSPDLLHRLAEDPRLDRLYDGFTLLFAAREGRNEDFLLDWRIVPGNVELPPGPGSISAWTAYPRPGAAQMRALEGFVDGDRVDPQASCLAFAIREEAQASAGRAYEFAPWGPSKLWIDDRQIMTIPGSPKAILGRGAGFAIWLEAGSHQITVLTCRGTDEKKRIGFYLRRTDG